MSRYLVSVLFTAFFLVSLSTGFAISPTEHDDFEDGTTMGWEEGLNSPNPPTNVSDGGPSGVGDNYLENSSHGDAGAGGKMAMFNRFQWTGDYNAVGSALTISADMANLGNELLSIRLGVSSGSTRYVSSNLALLAPGSWVGVNFLLTDAEMTLVGGAGTLSSVLDNVGELRIISAVAPAWQGDVIVGTLGVDNFRVTSVPVELQRFNVD